MTSEQIAELRMLEDDAFAAPWALDRAENGCVRAIDSVREGPLGVQHVFGPEDEPPLFDCDSAALVVAMRNSLLRILDEREALLEALRRATDAIAGEWGDSSAADLRAVIAKAES